MTVPEDGASHYPAMQCSSNAVTEAAFTMQKCQLHLKLPLLWRYGRPRALRFPPLNLSRITPDLPVLYRLLALYCS